MCPLITKWHTQGHGQTAHAQHIHCTYPYTPRALSSLTCTHRAMYVDEVPPFAPLKEFKWPFGNTWGEMYGCRMEGVRGLLAQIHAVFMQYPCGIHAGSMQDPCGIHVGGAGEACSSSQAPSMVASTPNDHSNHPNYLNHPPKPTQSPVAVCGPPRRATPAALRSPA